MKESEIEVRKVVSRSELIKRGWTKGNIEEFLGKPDAIMEYPGSVGNEEYVYDLERVETVEGFKAFRSAQYKRAATAIAQLAGAVKGLEAAKDALKWVIE
jgi:hypothetical protein